MQQTNTAPVRILNIVGAMYPGGIENFIMNLYRHIDRTRYQFDFCVHDRRDGDYVPEIESMGGKVYLLPRLTRHPVRNLAAIEKLVRREDYPIVIRHTANALIAPQLLAAKRGGAITICHSHSSTDPQLTLHRIGRRMMKKAADVRIACTPEAGKWMYGDLDFQVIRNAIDIDTFLYSRERTRKISEEFHLEGRHVYGHIGNFFAAKNHLYLLKIYKEILDRDPDAACFCIGDGECRPQIEAGIRDLGLSGKVILTGLRRDVPDFMSALDVMIFPSTYEGLPLTLIEAQAAGLPSLISDRITKSVILTDGVIEQRSIDGNPADWAKEAIRIAESHPDRTCQREKIAAAGYDVTALARWYEQFFARLLDKKSSR